MKKFIYTAVLLVGVASLTSCLKGNKEILDPNGSPAVVEWSTTKLAVPLETRVGYTLFPVSFDIKPSINMNLVINYTGGEPAPADVTVNIGLNTAALTAYNNAISTTTATYIILPPTFYTLPSTAVIPKGQRSVTVPVALRTDQFTFAKPYILPVQITSTTAGAISGNYGTIMLNVGAKNAMDGHYSHAYTSTLGNGTNTVDLITIGQYQVSLSPGLLGVYSNAQTLTLDPATNRLTVSMTSLLPIATDVANSTFDPATRTLKVKWTSNGGARTFDETYTYLGSR